MIETLSIQDLQNRLIRSKKTPFSTTLEITYGCNLNCVHCYNPTHKAETGELKFPELVRVLDELALLGCLTLTVTGGEIFTHPRIFEILEEAQKRAFQINLFTNAVLLTAERVEKIKKTSPNLVSVSVYGITRETYEAVTRVPGSFEKFMHGIELLADSGLPLLFKMPIMTLNRHEVEPAAEFFKRRGLKFIYSVEIHPRVDGNQEPLKYRLPPEDAAKLRLASQEELTCARSSKGSAGQPPEPFSCSCGKTSAAISPYGEMNLCVSTPYPRYSLKTGSLREGWNALIHFVENFKPSEKYECPVCPLVSFCSQGSMDAFLNTGDFNPCVPYFKETAKTVQHLLEIKNAR